MKSKFKILSLFLGLTLFLVACHKKEVIPIPESNAPIFKATGTFDGQSVQLLAGDNGVEMKNTVESINGVQKFVSTLGNDVYEIELGILDGQLGLQKNQEQLLNSLNTLYFAQKHSVPLYKIAKSDFENASAITKIDWFVNGSFVSQNELSIYESGIYDICAYVQFSSGETKYSCNTLNVGYQNNGNFELDYLIDQNNSLSSWISNSTHPISSIEWFENGVLISESSNYNSTVSGSDVNLSAVVRFQNGIVAKKNVLIDGNLTGKFINDFTENYQTPAVFSDYKIVLNFKKNGKEYHSILTENATNSFQLKKIDFYKLNANYKPIYLLSGDLIVDLVENEGDSPKKLILNVQFSVELEK